MFVKHMRAENNIFTKYLSKYTQLHFTTGYIRVVNFFTVEMLLYKCVNLDEFKHVLLSHLTSPHLKDSDRCISGDTCTGEVSLF